ncbi:MAG: response regulator [bacterium]|nr:response regulator [bacterium]
MANQLTDAEQVLDSLDKSAGRDAGAANRRVARQTWRKQLKVIVAQPGGDVRCIEVVSRNLSSGGLSFMHNGFLHAGTRCELQLVTADGAWIDVRAEVVRCRYVAGGAHEVSLRFDKPVDDSQFVSQELSASILLVDDAEDVLRLTGHFLSKAGAKVVTAKRGFQALKLVAEQDFDLILLDVEMPGVSGPEVAKALRERGLTVPIIAYTANDDQATREECLAAGCSEVLAKPLGKTELINAVTAFLAVEEPITSKLAGNPEMTEFIHDFLGSLPGRIQEMQRCVQAKDAENLGPLTRQLMVAASDNGGCGFGELSAAAGALAKTLTGTADWASAEGAMSTLNNLSRRVKETRE